jgi:hypothetical protein
MKEVDMFEPITLFTLLLAPVAAYLAGVVIFTLLDILYKNHCMQLAETSSTHNGH